MTFGHSLLRLTLGALAFGVGAHGCLWALLQFAVRGAKSAGGGSYFHLPSFLVALVVGPLGLFLSAKLAAPAYRALRSSGSQFTVLAMLGAVVLALLCAGSSMLQLIFYI